MACKVYNHVADQGLIQPILAVDVGAQYIRSSAILKKMRTPTFDDYYNKYS
jgi:hypothetical protein